MAPSSKQQVVQVTSTADAKDDFSHLSVMEADIPSPARGEVSLSNVRRRSWRSSLEATFERDYLPERYVRYVGAHRQRTGHIRINKTLLNMYARCARSPRQQQMELPDCCHTVAFRLCIMVQVLVKLFLRPVNPTDVLQAGAMFGDYQTPFIPGMHALPRSSSCSSRCHTILMRHRRHLLTSSSISGASAFALSPPRPACCVFVPHATPTSIACVSK